MKYWFFSGLLILSVLCSCDKADIGGQDVSSETKSGSYATMLTVGNKLYVVNKTAITTFDVSNPADPKEIDRKDAGVDIESLYYYNNLLLIGSANNMYIYSLTADGIPERQSATQYSNAFDREVCTSDPIVIHNNYAYVTLSATNNICAFWQRINELRVYDLSDFTRPILLDVVSMSAPKGLGLGKSHLFVCDQNTGLQVFNIDDPKKPVLVKTIGGFKAYDLIVNNNLLIVVADKRLLQFDISDEDDIKPLGIIYL
jgi:hypothetical protein